MAQNRLDCQFNFYSNFDNATNNKEIFKFAKQRYKVSMDIKINKYIKDDKVLLLAKNTKLNGRRCQYYWQLLNEEFPSLPLKEEPKTVRPLQIITMEKFESAIERFNKFRTVGSDNTSAGLRPVWTYCYSG